jgi:SecD/SecF fusion protein
MSEVITRSLATSFCTLLPVLALLLFGGETLKDFAFALMVGIASGAYSSIFIASPVLTHWKEREGSYRNRRARLVRDLGFVPPYATALDGTPIDVEPVRGQRRERSGAGNWSAGAFGNRAPTPAGAGDEVSQEEFDKMVRELDIERDGEQAPARASGRRVRGNGRRGGPAGGVPLAGAGTGTVPVGTSAPNAAPAAAPAEPKSSQVPQDPAADLTPEDLVLKEQPKRQKRSRNRRHGRSR